MKLCGSRPSRGRFTAAERGVGFGCGLNASAAAAAQPLLMWGVVLGDVGLEDWALAASADAPGRGVSDEAT